ncbi:MAG: conjugal transfer protein, partial [Haloplanus sp.]
MQDAAREYVRVTPSRSNLAPGTVVEQLGGLHGLGAGSDGVLASLTDRGSNGPPIFEFLALSEGADEAVEFYYGVEDRLDALEERLRTLYPPAFAVERVTLDVATRLVPNTAGGGADSDGGSPLDAVEPMGVTWRGNPTRGEDWMTTIPTFSAVVEYENEHSRAPLAPLIDQLAAAEHPLAFQVLFRRKPDWTHEAMERKRKLREGEDRFVDWFAGEVLGGTEQEHHSPSTTGRQRRYLDVGGRERVESIDEKQPQHTFAVNLRALALLDNDTDQEALDRRLDDLAAVFDHLNGAYYRVSAKRLRRGLTKGRNARKAQSRFFDRRLATGRFGTTGPELVLNPDELANFVVVPPSTQLTTEGGRGTQATPESRSPLPRPQTEHMREFREGMAIGYALDENGEPEPEPTRVPPRLLPTHYLRAATTGAGKSKALVNDALSLYADTEGPIVLIDPKGDGLTENYMRAHASRFGF